MYASALQNSNLSQMQSFKNGAFLKKILFCVNKNNPQISQKCLKNKEIFCSALSDLIFPHSYLYLFISSALHPSLSSSAFSSHQPHHLLLLPNP